MYENEEHARADDGAILPLGRLTKTFTEDGDGNISSISVSHNGTTYRVTLTWTENGNPATISGWERVINEDPQTPPV